MRGTGLLPEFVVGHFAGGFACQHGDTFPDGVGEAGRAADQLGAVRGQLQSCLGKRADQKFKETRSRSSWLGLTCRFVAGGRRRRA